MKIIIWVFAIIICFAENAPAQNITLDYYFNHEQRINTGGKTKRFHYLWTDTTNTGFSVLGMAFKKAGATLDTLDKAPTQARLSKASIYIIVDPDSKKETPAPHYIESRDIDVITAWVYKGGVLLMLANDSANVELPHFNKLAARFGMHFNDDMQNHVVNDEHFDEGAIIISHNPLFNTASKIFIKDACSISVTSSAKPDLKNRAGAVIIASARYGRGTVLAVGDPWLYNEYTNGRLPAGFENDKAANDVVAWLLKQVKNK